MDVAGSEFIQYCNGKDGGLVMSINDSVQHCPYLMKPYLKAKMMHGLCVLLSIVEDKNLGCLSRKMAMKWLKEVKLTGDLTGNHLFAVGVLQGLIVHHEFLPCLSFH